MRARLATRNMTTERRCSATLDSTHHLELAKADVAGVGLTPNGSMGVEYIRDLQSWAGHRRRRLTAGLSPHLYQ